MENDTALQTVKTKIANASRLAGRSGKDVDLIAISKTRSAEEVRPLLLEGQRTFGENRVQEATAKWPELRAEFEGVELHLVGQLQSNKAEEAVQFFDYIHSLDRPSLIKALARAMEKLDRRIPCFIQVNIGEESQKGGCNIADVPSLLESAAAADIPVCGLMCIPPSEVQATPYFALLAKLAKDNGLSGLSMGMSGDFETAVMIGATHVRVGTALFGPRS